MAAPSPRSIHLSNWYLGRIQLLVARVGPNQLLVVVHVDSIAACDLIDGIAALRDPLGGLPVVSRAEVTPMAAPQSA